MTTARDTKVEVQLEGGKLAMCSVIKRMGFNHDIGALTIWVSHEGKEFMAVRKLGAWVKWTAADRTQPLVEHLIRIAKENQAKGDT